MPDVTAERRNARRHALVLAASVMELPRGAKLRARTSDISHTGCYLDTLNPFPKGSQVRIRITHRKEVLEAVGRVVYVSAGLGMGIAFEEIDSAQQAMLVRWLAAGSETR